jgi:hypothetical protein
MPVMKEYDVEERRKMLIPLFCSIYQNTDKAEIMEDLENYVAEYVVGGLSDIRCKDFAKQTRCDRRAVCLFVKVLILGKSGSPAVVREDESMSPSVLLM